MEAILMMAEGWAIACGIGAGVVTWVATFTLFFTNSEEFLECLRFTFTPDFISLFRGEWLEDQWGSLKLGVWLVVGIAAGYGTYALLSG